MSDITKALVLIAEVLGDISSDGLPSEHDLMALNDLVGDMVDRETAMRDLQRLAQEYDANNQAGIKHETDGTDSL